MERSTLSTKNVVRYLAQLDLPATRAEIVERARANGAPPEVLSVLQSLPDRRYRQMDELMVAIGEQV